MRSSSPTSTAIDFAWTRKSSFLWNRDRFLTWHFDRLYTFWGPIEASSLRGRGFLVERSSAHFARFTISINFPQLIACEALLASTMKIRLNGQRRFFVSKNFPPFIVSRERRADFPEGYFYFICRKTASQISLKRKFTAMFRRVSSNANVNVCCACFNIFCAEDSRVIFSENKQFRHVAKSIKMFYKKNLFPHQTLRSHVLWTWRNLILAFL